MSCLRPGAIIVEYTCALRLLPLGVINEKGEILSNVRDTYITAPGTGFLPSETAEHHRAHILRLTELALKEANCTPKDLSCLAYTKGSYEPFRVLCMMFGVRFDSFSLFLECQKFYKICWVLLAKCDWRFSMYASPARVILHSRPNLN